MSGWGDYDRPDPVAGRGEVGDGCGRGCIVGFAVVALLGFVALQALPGMFQIGGPTVERLSLDRRWVQHEVVIAPAGRTAELTVTLTFRGSGVPPARLTVSAPAVAIIPATPIATSPSSAPPETSFVSGGIGWLTDPAVRVELVRSDLGDASARRCTSPCELPLVPPPCSAASCKAHWTLHLTLADSEAPAPVRLVVEAGATAGLGEQLPEGFDVTIEREDG